MQSPILAEIDESLEAYSSHLKHLWSEKDETGWPEYDLEFEYLDGSLGHGSPKKTSEQESDEGWLQVKAFVEGRPQKPDLIQINTNAVRFFDKSRRLLGQLRSQEAGNAVDSEELDRLFLTLKRVWEEEVELWDWDRAPVAASVMATVLQELVKLDDFASRYEWDDGPEDAGYAGGDALDYFGWVRVRGNKRKRAEGEAVEKIPGADDAPVDAADKEWVPPEEKELQQMKKELNDLKQSRIVTTSHTGATGMATYTMEQLLHPDPDKPVLYVPEEHKERIRRIYGGMTFGDFDELFDFNAKIGAPYPSCFKSMMYWLNEVEGDLHDQHAKLAHNRPLSDVFNIVQSAVRSRIGEKVWY